MCLFLTCGHSSRLLRRLCSACEYVYSAHTHTGSLAHTHTRTRSGGRVSMTTVDLMYHKMKVEQGLVHLGLLEFYHFILRLCEQVCLACATGWELHTFTRTHARFHTQTHITHTHTHRRPFLRRSVPTRHCASFWIIRRGRRRTRDPEQFRASLKPCGHQASEGDTPGTVFGNVYSFKQTRDPSMLYECPAKQD